MIRFNCGKCGAGVRVGDDSAGRQGECPQCGAILTVPAPISGPATAIQSTAPAAGGSTMAKVALVLGILGVIPLVGGVLGLTALILGIVVLASRRGGKGMAVIGMVLGLVLSGISTVVVIVYLLMPTAAKVRVSAQRASCQAKLVTIGLAVRQYAEKNKGVMPNDLHHLVSEGLIDETALLCPRAAKTAGDVYEYDYIYLAPANGTYAADATIVACDRKGSHSGGRCVLFVSGMAQWRTDQQFDAELARNPNREFAKYLRDLEGESPRLPAPPRRPTWPSKGM
jgi:competence protein ComGC